MIKEGNGVRSLLHFPMMNDSQVNRISGMVESLLAGDPASFLVEVRITPGNHIKIYLDGDAGITIDKCVALNRALYKQLEESDLYPGGDFSLEVSSAGLDEPLKLRRQYQKNINRNVEVVMLDGQKVVGKLVNVTDKDITVEEYKGKKKEVISHTILFDNIKSTKVQVVF
jgi:ribosome maturation factor RimP